MRFIHFIDKLTTDFILKNGIKVDNCYRGKGILIYPEIEIQFRARSTEKEYLKEEKRVNKLMNNEKWEAIATLGLRQNKKQVTGIITEIAEFNWPLKVFIDVDASIASKFGKMIDEENISGIKYGAEKSISEVIKGIESPRFVLEALFIVDSPSDLVKLIEMFSKSGGGIWGAHSFDCMIENDINPEFIIETKDFKKHITR